MHWLGECGSKFIIRKHRFRKECEYFNCFRNSSNPVPRVRANVQQACLPCSLPPSSPSSSFSAHLCLSFLSPPPPKPRPPFLLFHPFRSTCVTHRCSKRDFLSLSSPALSQSCSEGTAAAHRAHFNNKCSSAMRSHTLSGEPSLIHCTCQKIVG